LRLELTHFTISYLTLGCLLDYKDPSIKIFTSDEWKNAYDEWMKRILVLQAYGM